MKITETECRRCFFSLKSLITVLSLLGFLTLGPIVSADEPGSTPHELQLEGGVEPAISEEINVTITEETFRPPTDWQTEQARILSESLPISSAMQSKADAKFAELGQQGFLKLVDQNKMKIEGEPYGKAEINSIDEVLFVRVVHAESKVALLFLEEGTVSPETKHFRQFIARQHIDSGDKNSWGRKPGRDVALVWTKHGEVIRTEYLPRFFPGTPNWWNDYYYATVKKPEKADRIFGLFCGGLQVGASACVAGVKMAIDPSKGFDEGALIFSALFGYQIATRNSTYRNFIYRGTELSQSAKLWAVSYLYAYSLSIYHSGSFSVLNISDPQNLLLLAHISLNTLLHNLGRKAWYGLPQIKNWLRNSTGTKKLSIAGHQFDTGIKEASWAQQFIYLIPFTLKLVGLVGLGYEIAIPGINYNLDLGTLLLLGSIPIAHEVVVKYAESNDHPEAAEMRQKWNRIKWAPVTIPRSIFGLAVRTVRRSAQNFSDACSKLLTTVI